MREEVEVVQQNSGEVYGKEIKWRKVEMRCNFELQVCGKKDCELQEKADREVALEANSVREVKKCGGQG